ncbi:TM0106 family RecB-like putative nuclease [Acidobacteriia bacterium AH_259_A11_L15]|nr:TM0106 family RecB-like putative nuclease [Acidobacteriia bacterium AH_259_A11_L15]
MSSSPRNRVTAQDFYDYDKCPHRTYLDHHGNTKEKLPLSDFLNLLFERALLHEEDVIKDLEHVVPEGKTLGERAALTLDLMKTGIERIYQGVLLQDDDSGIPDLLEKVNGKSDLGDYFYKPVDIKSGSGYESESKGTLRKDYGKQLFHYARLLERVQGMFPPEGEILNKRGDRVPYPLGQFARLYQEVEPEIRALVAGTKTDEPALCGDCKYCQWWGHCEEILVRENDLTLLPGVGRDTKVTLNEVGVRSIEDVARFDFGGVKLRRIGPKTAESMPRAARVTLSGEMEVLRKPDLSDPAVKIYFDFEDDPTQELVYLCGLWAEPAIKGLNYHGFFCTGEVGEARMWTDFQKLCADIMNIDYVVFHYSAYEKTKLNELERKYGVQEQHAVETFKGRMKDLLLVVKNSVVLPTRGYGLKELASFIGRPYQTQDAGGAQAIVWFQEYQKDPSRQDLFNKILGYNREDCLVLKAMYEWLKRL